MSSSNEIAVSVRGLSKAYTIAHNTQQATTAGEALMNRLKNPLRKVEKETFWALRDVEFDIHKGDVVGIIGRNGAGKSTLLKVLSRITEPTTGQIDLYGRVGSLLEVGTGFHPELTGRENVFLNGAILGMSKREIARHFDAIVDFSGTEQFLDTPVKRYSSGMYVRLAFAVAAHLNPEILIVDEVLAVGDAAFQAKCMSKMKDVASTGRTILFVSHNMAAIQQLCSRAILLKAGRVHKEGPTDQVAMEYMSDSFSVENGCYDLSVHAARSPSHAPIIRKVQLSTQEGVPTSKFNPDDSLIVDIALEPQSLIREPRVALAIEDNYGRRLMTMASYFDSGTLSDTDKPCNIRCVLPEIKLGSGRYLLSVSVSDKYQGLLDSIDNAIWIEVEWNNNFGNGEPYDPIYGPILAHSLWDKRELTSDLPLGLKDMAATK